MNAILNFSHLEEETDFFPYNCANGFYFLWNSRLSSPDHEETEEDPESLLKQELRHLKKQLSR